MICMIEESVGVCAYKCGELCSSEWEVVAIKIKTKSSAAFSVTDTFVFSCKQSTKGDE